MSLNSNLHKAKAVKNDEFYTQISDIENELKHYEKYFKDKHIFCNFETFWKRLHTHGSHPGLSNEEDSIFRLNLVQISTLEILKRYDRNFPVRKKINEE